MCMRLVRAVALVSGPRGGLVGVFGVVVCGVLVGVSGVL